MSDTGQTNTGAAPAAQGSESALTDTGLTEFFGPDSQSAAPAVEGAPAAQPASATPAPVPAVPAPVAPVPPVPAPAAAPAPNVSEELLALRNEIAQLRPAPVGPDGKPVTAPPDPLRSVPDYQFTLPPALMEQLNAPEMETRSRALSATISAVGKTIHNQVLNQVQGLLAELSARIPSEAGRVMTESAEQQRVVTDFYGKYGQYNTPMLRPIVQLAVLEVGKANPALAANGWTPAFRDAVGAYLQQNVPIAPVPAAPAPGPVAPPAMMGGGGARPVAPNLSGDEQALAEFFG